MIYRNGFLNVKLKNYFKYKRERRVVNHSVEDRNYEKIIKGIFFLFP